GFVAPSSVGSSHFGLALPERTFRPRIEPELLKSRGAARKLEDEALIRARRRGTPGELRAWLAKERQAGSGEAGREGEGFELDRCGESDRSLLFALLATVSNARELKEQGFAAGIFGFALELAQVFDGGVARAERERREGCTKGSLFA